MQPETIHFINFYQIDFIKNTASLQPVPSYIYVPGYREIKRHLFHTFVWYVFAVVKWVTRIHSFHLCVICLCFSYPSLFSLWVFWQLQYSTCFKQKSLVEIPRHCRICTQYFLRIGIRQLEVLNLYLYRDDLWKFWKDNIKTLFF